jgi:peptidoglycan/LPS O-acetylase OafA/YrhL
LLSKDLKHKNNFNFLRLLLAVFVLLSHSPELIDGNRHREILTNIFGTISLGELAVAGFFLLSGYLIVQSWQRTPDLFSFLKKRILRIYPAFIVATLVSAFIVGPLGASPSEYFTQFNLFQFLKGMLLLRPPDVPPVFVDQPYPVVNASLWTIAYEFRCYVLVALLGMLGFISRQRLWLIFSVFVLIISPFPKSLDKVTFPGSSFLIGDPSDFIQFLAFFCAGGCFYLFRDKVRHSRSWIFFAFSLTVLGLFDHHALRLILPTLGAYVFFWFSFLSLSPLQQFGKLSDISYGTYLYGWPSQKLLFWYFPLMSPWLNFLLACGISFACGLLSWHLVEKPFLRLKKSEFKAQAAPVPDILYRPSEARPSEVENRSQYD